MIPADIINEFHESWLSYEKGLQIKMYVTLETRNHIRCIFNANIAVVKYIVNFNVTNIFQSNYSSIISN